MVNVPESVAFCVMLPTVVVTLALVGYVRQAALVPPEPLGPIGLEGLDERDLFGFDCSMDP